MQGVSTEHIIRFKKHKIMDKTSSRSSPRGGRRGCLCPNNTYSSECCDGSLQAQGIGSIDAIEIEIEPSIFIMENEENATNNNQ